MEKKITLATLKSFIRKNSDDLYINVRSSFDGMTDGLEYYKNGFSKAEKTNEFESNTLGISGAWLVGGSRNHFSAYNENGFEGIRVSNCCGSFILAVRGN